MNSRTYQLSAQTNEFNKDDNKYFSHAVTKLLTAEQLLDAICTVTDVPEKFAGMPLGTRAVQLPDGEVNHPFLKTFGQPARELACECEREGDSNLAQALQLINGPTVNEKLRTANNRIGRLLGKKTSDVDMLNELYLATLSRLPAEGEVKAALEHVGKAEPETSARPGKTCSGRCSTPRSSCSGINRPGEMREPLPQGWTPCGSGSFRSAPGMVQGRGIWGAKRGAELCARGRSSVPGVGTELSPCPPSTCGEKTSSVPPCQGEWGVAHSSPHHGNPPWNHAPWHDGSPLQPLEITSLPAMG